MLKAEVLETMLYGCVTWSPRQCHYDTLRRAHHSFLTRCIGWRKRTRTDHPISYLETLVKTGSESVEKILRKRRILFAGSVARMEDNLWGVGSPWGDKRKNGWDVSWTTSEFSVSTPTSGRSQPRTRGNAIGQQNKGAELFMTKWIAAERARAALWHAETYPNVTGRTKERVSQSKRARTGLLGAVV